MAAPTIANLDAPYAFVVAGSLATFAAFLTFFLPPPGLHLPSVQKTGDMSVVVVDKATNALTLTVAIDAIQPLTNLSVHQASFMETYTERFLNVTRPQMHETCMDPDIYLHEGSYAEGTRFRDHSVLLRAWGDHTQFGEEEDKSVVHHSPIN